MKFYVVMLMNVSHSPVNLIGVFKKQSLGIHLPLKEHIQQLVAFIFPRKVKSVIQNVSWDKFLKIC